MAKRSSRECRCTQTAQLLNVTKLEIHTKALPTVINQSSSVILLVSYRPLRASSVFAENTPTMESRELIPQNISPIMKASLKLA